MGVVYLVGLVARTDIRAKNEGCDGEPHVYDTCMFIYGVSQAYTLRVQFKFEVTILILSSKPITRNWGLQLDKSMNEKRNTHRRMKE